MCAAPAVAPSKVIASTSHTESLVATVSASVSAFHDKTVRLIAKRAEIESGSAEMRGFISAIIPDELPVETAVDSLATRVSEKSMQKFRSEIEALQKTLAEAKNNLILAQFCFNLFDQFKQYDLVDDQFNRTLTEADDLKANPFGLGDTPRRLKSCITKMCELLTTAKAEALAHKIILSESQSESLERGIAIVNHMKREISKRGFLSASFAGFDLTLSPCNTFYHNLSILYLQRKFVRAEALSGKELSEAFVEIARMIADLDPVLRVKIQDKRPKVVKEEIAVTSMVLEEAEAERTELYIKAEIQSYKIGLDIALSELREYIPHRTKLPFETASGAGGA